MKTITLSYDDYDLLLGCLQRARSQAMSPPISFSAMTVQQEKAVKEAILLTVHEIDRLTAVIT